MTVKSGAAWSGLVVCKDSTGALSTPSVGPAGTLYVDGTANGASVTISGSNPYKWTVTLPSLTAGQCVSMYITATIATVATASVVAEDVADTVLASDNYARLGAPAGASISVDMAAVKAETAAILDDTDDIGVAGAGLTAIGDTRLANLDAAISTRSTYAGGDTSGVTTLLARIIGTLATGTHNPQTGDAYGRLTGTVEPAIADLPTNSELATALAGADDATLAAIAALNNLSAAQVNAEVVDVLRTDTIPDSYPGDGSQPTIAQAILSIQQFLQERAVSGTTVTVKKPDGSTTAMTFTLNDATNPTSITRAS